ALTAPAPTTQPGPAPARSDQRLQRRPCPALVQRVQRGQVSGDATLVVRQVPEHITVSDERAGFLALLAGKPGEAVREPVDYLDRLAPLIDTLRVARPAGHHRGRTSDLAADR